MSIAILRTFVAKRNEEHEEMVNKRNKSRQKVSQDMPPGSDGDGALTSQDDEINGDHEKELNGAADKAEDLSKETTLAPSWKRTRELKPPIVLEVMPYFTLQSSSSGFQYERVLITYNQLNKKCRHWLLLG